MRRIFDGLLALLWLAGWWLFGVPRRRLSATPEFQQVELIPLFDADLGDVTRNFIYYVVFGIIATRLGLQPRTIVALAACLSITTEFIQLFSRSRHPSVTDFVVNTLGATAGIVVMALQQKRRRRML